VIALADDHESANGDSVLNFWQAQDRAKEIVRGPAGGSRPLTVGEALEHYKQDLKGRGGGLQNVLRVIGTLPDSLAAKSVALLTARELRHWRDSEIERGIKASSADRNARALKACLNQAAADDARITNTNAWKTGLKRLPEEETPANRIIPDDVIKRIVIAAREVNEGFGLLCEVGAVTGARPSQIFKLEVGDLRDQNGAASLNMPSSRKGRRRRVTRTSVPIPSSLAKRLRQHAADRGPSEPLIALNGKRAGRVQNIYVRLWREMAAAIGLDAGVSFYSLRHSSIVRQLIAGVPIRVVASHHDSSVPILESVYSRHIGTVSDALVRGALIDLGSGV
jgi:integrase